MINTRKNKIIIYVFVACIILAGCYYIFFVDQEGIGKKIPEKKEITQDVFDEHKDIKGDIQHKKRIPEIAQQEEKINNKRVQFMRDWYEAAKAPIVFYGKVVDQNGSPVVGATVKMSTASHDGALFRETVTDEEGLFSLKGVNAKDLYIDDIKLTGYEPARSRWSFNYGARHYTRHVPDQNNPVVFDMWKKVEAEPVIKSRKRYDLSSDGSLYYIDLVNGKGSKKQTKHVDLIVELKADDEVVGKRYNWSIAFKVEDGGLIETQDTFLYKAPENGYQDVIELNFDKNERDWESIIKRKFYLQSRNGKVYAALTCDIYSYNNKEGRITINSIVNPNGSTNLQYDPSKRILDP